MTFLKSDLTNNHFYLKTLEKGKLYKVSLKHDNLAKFIIEILDINSHEILDRPNDYSTTSMPNIPYSLTFRACADGLLAIHYDTEVLKKARWTKAYDIEVVEVMK